MLKLFPVPLPARWRSDPSHHETSERMRSNLTQFLAVQDALAEQELQRIKANAEVLDLKDYPHLRLSSYNRFQKRKITWAFWKMAKDLEDTEALKIDGASQEAEALANATALLRDELPLKLTRVILKGNDHQTGEFTLEVGGGLYSPVHFWVHLRGKYGLSVPLGWNGHLLQGGPDGQIRAAQCDLKLGIESVNQIIRNGGLYCANSWSDPRFVINRNEEV